MHRFLKQNSLYILLFTIFSLSLITKTKAQIYDTTKHFYTDYISSYKDSTLSLQLLATNKYTRFQLHYIPQNSKEQIMKFNPNESTHLGFGVDYKWLGFRLAFAMPFIFNDDKKYGRTTQLDLQAHIYSRKFVTDISFQAYKGFYIENPQQFDVSWHSNLPYPSRSDIRTQTASIDVFYIFNNERYSARAPYNQTEWQKKSAGSFITGGYLAYFHLRGDSSIVAVPINNVFSDSSKIVRANIEHLGWSMGYAYTLVIKRHYFLSLSLTPGVSMQLSNAKTTNHVAEENMLKIAMNFSGRFAAGYNGDTYYFGILSIWDNSTLNNSKIVKLQYSSGLVRVYFGRRLSAQKKLLPKLKQLF